MSSCLQHRRPEPCFSCVALNGQRQQAQGFANLQAQSGRQHNDAMRQSAFNSAQQAQATHDAASRGMRQNEALQAQMIGERRRQIREDREFLARQDMKKEAIQEDRLLFRREMNGEAQRRGIVLSEDDLELAWVQYLRAAREGRRQQFWTLKQQFDGINASLLLAARAEQTALDADWATLQERRRFTVAASWLPWAIGLGLLSLVLLARVGWFGKILLLGVAIGYAVYLITKRKEVFGDGTPEFKNGLALYATTALPVACIVGGVLSLSPNNLLALTNLVTAAVGIYVGVRARRERTNHYGMQAEAQQIVEAERALHVSVAQIEGRDFLAQAQANGFDIDEVRDVFIAPA